MLATGSTSAKGAVHVASQQRTPAMLASRAVSRAPCRGVRGQPQVILVPRLRNVEAVEQRFRTVAVADGAASTTTTTTETAAAGLLELNVDTFNDYINAAGNQLVVVDFFTDWCGPCKLIYPELVKLSAELSPAATIVKFNCNQANKDLAKQLGIKVAPTFHLYKGGRKVADMTGAKVDKLRALITEHMSGSEQN